MPGKARPKRTAVSRTETKRIANRKKMPTVCDHEMASDPYNPELILHCKDCAGPHSIEDNKCLKAMLNAYSKQFNIKKLTVSHYIEKQYYGKAIELLKMLSSFLQELDNVALRDPVVEYFPSKAQKQKNLHCFKCPMNPSKMFTRMKNAFTNDITAFYSFFVKTVTMMPKFSNRYKNRCPKCLKTSVEDMNYLFDEYEKIARFVTAEAFNVIIQGNMMQQALFPRSLEQYLGMLTGYQRSAATMHPGTTGGGFVCPKCKSPLPAGSSGCANCGFQFPRGNI